MCKMKNHFTGRFINQYQDFFSMINKETYLIPISSCLKTFGYCRSSIIDFQLSELEFIPNSLFELMIKHKYWKIQDIIDYYGKDYEKNLIEYFEFLYVNRYAYFGEKYETELFPDFSMEWDFPALITNAIVDIADFDKFEYSKLIESLDEIHCFHLQLRFLKEIRSKDKIEELVKLVYETSFHTLSLYLPFDVFEDYEKVSDFIKEYPKIDNITVFSSPENRKVILDEYFAFINFTVNSFDPESTCGYVDTKFFSLSVNHFTESQLHNTCLNRKICIDSEGYIKNCPSMQHHYGHITETTLAEAIDKQGFKDCWFIKKDDIDVCQDCEFRHICTDCRAFIKDPNNIYSQPAKCGYNPYIAKWQNEEGWISVEQWRKENPEWEKQAIELRELHKKYIAINE